jgi:hypothetical protein
LRCAPTLAALRLKLARETNRGNLSISKPKDWRSQSISLPRLEVVCITDFSGEVQQLELLKFILRCALMLKTITVKLALEVNRENFRGGIRKIDNIFLGYPSVCYTVYLYAGGHF